VVLVGIGGYGVFVTKDLLKDYGHNGVTVAGIVDPFAGVSPCIDRITELNIPVFNNLDDFYDKSSAQLAVLSTPIQFHAAQSIIAMEHGSDVLCEKPIAATLVQAYAMQKVQRQTGTNLSIGYQWSYCQPIAQLKQDILNNKYGKPVHLKTIISWPRNAQYFARSWAGKIKNQDGYVLDSIAMNAAAHYLHNMFFVLGDKPETSAQPQRMKVSVCRANKIENYDTAALDVILKDGVHLQYLATHAAQRNINPSIHYQFEKGYVILDTLSGNDHLIGHFDDGTTVDYGDPQTDITYKVWYAIDICRGKKKPVCTIESALPHLRCINAISQFTPIRLFDERLIGFDGKEQLTYVKGLDDLLLHCYSGNKMPWELEQSAVFAPTEIDMTDYHEFEGVYGQ